MKQELGEGVNDDGALITRVLARDEGAVAGFVRSYQNLVRRIVFRIVDDQADREEICQDVFLKAIGSLRSFRRESRLSTWIGRIAYREAIQYLRRRAALPNAEHVQPPEELCSSAPSAQAAFETRELEGVIARAVDQLTPAQKTAVTLFYLQEMDVTEVADVIGIPVNTVKSHLLRSRRTLRELLQEEAKARGYES